MVNNKTKNSILINFQLYFTYNFSNKLKINAIIKILNILQKITKTIIFIN